MWGTGLAQSGLARRGEDNRGAEKLDPVYIYICINSFYLPDFGFGFSLVRGK